MKDLKETSTDEVLTEGLETADNTEAGKVEDQKEKKEKKEQTPEEAEQLQTGIDKIKQFGVSPRFATVMDNLAVAWNGDKDELGLKKENLMKEFGGSDNLKDYVDGEFQTELSAIQGTAKVCSILNNVKSFYARRAGTTKVKTVQVNIGGTLYNVDSAYYSEIANEPREVKRELLLAHAGTQVATSVPEVL